MYSSGRVGFHEWFLLNWLAALGWPKTKGLVKKTVYLPATVAVHVGRDMVRLGCILGAENPDTAVRLLARLFAFNAWTAESTDEFVQRWLPERALEHAPRFGTKPWIAIQSLGELGTHFNPLVTMGAKDVNWEDATGAKR